VIAEAIFNWPGLGQLILQGIAGRDYTLVQGSVLLLALIFIAVNTLTDILYAVVDPRIRLSV
jgi:peptide/nickel transport system permease protein